MKKEEIKIHLTNFRFAIDNCTATKKQFDIMENSLTKLVQEFLPEEFETKKDEKA